MASLIARMHRPVVRAVGRRLGRATTPDEMRRVIGRTRLLFVPCTGTVTEPTQHGGVSGLRITPKRGGPSDRTVLMFHGGGYVFGSSEMYRAFGGRLAKACDATVYLPDYRLAPEHPYPAAVEDGLAVYRSLVESGSAERIVVGGDSAGGGLTVAVLQAAREAGLPMPAASFLFSPWLDLRGTAADRSNLDRDILITPAPTDLSASWYRGDHPADHPAISPILGTMEGLPPTLVQATSAEILESDSIRFAERARAAGVDVTLDIQDDLWHVWQLMAPVLPEARASLAATGAFVSAHCR